MADKYKQAGLLYNGNGVCNCCVWAPGKEKMELALYRTGEPAFIALEKDEKEYWSTTLKDVTPGMLYKFRINGKEEYPDPVSLSQPDGVHGASAIADHVFNWT